MKFGRNQEWMMTLYEGSDARKFFESVSEVYPEHELVIAQAWIASMNAQSNDELVRVDQIVNFLSDHDELVKYALGYFGGSGSVQVSLRGK
jgi:hypothetical protein